MPLIKDDIKSKLSRPWLLTPWPFHAAVGHALEDMQSCAEPSAHHKAMQCEEQLSTLLQARLQQGCQ